MPSHPDRIRQNYDPDVLFPIEVPDTEIEIDDLPVDRPSDATEDPADPELDDDMRS